MESHPVAAKVGPYVWLVLQGVSVVASILLAFAIDAWWTHRAENREKNSALVSIKQELIEARVAIQDERKYRRALVGTETVLLEAVAKGRYDDKEKTLDHRISELLWYSSWDTGEVLQRFPSSEHFSAIESSTLRQSLISWQSVRAQLASVSDQDYQVYSEFTTPYFARNASLPQIAALGFRHGRADGYGVDPNVSVPVGKEVDHSALLANAEFAGVVVRKLWVDTDVLYSLDGTETAIEELIELIDAELEATS